MRIRGRLSLAIVEHLRKPMTFADLHAILGGDKRSMRTALATLVKRGHVKIISGDGRPGNPWIYKASKR